MRSSRRLVIVVALVLALGLGACSKKSHDANKPKPATSTTEKAVETTTSAAVTTTTVKPGTGPTDAYAAGIATGLSSGDPTKGDIVMAPTDAACVGRTWAKVIGLTELHKGGAPANFGSPSYDFAALGLTGTQAGDMVDAFAPCGVDILQKVTAALEQPFPVAKRSCMTQHLDAATVRKMLVSGLQDPAAQFQQDTVRQLATACHLS